MVKKHVMLVGKYDDILKFFKKVKSVYVFEKTKFFDMPSQTIKEQLDEFVKDKQTLGMVSYCKVLEHRKDHPKDPIVELVTDFIFIEDVFTANNEWVKKDLMAQYKPWGGDTQLDIKGNVDNA